MLLKPTKNLYSLNAALTYYNIKDFKNAIKYLSLSKSSKNPAVVEKAIRFNALSHLQIGDLKQTCANFIQLLNKFPKRMYQQEFNKIYESEKVLLPLMIQENYYKKICASKNSIKDKLDNIVNISDSISFGDNVETSIYTDQNWPSLHRDRWAARRPVPR